MNTKSKNCTYNTELCFNKLLPLVRSYTDAEEILRTTLDMVTKMAKQNQESISERWEPLLNNLGHCCRKNKKYGEALVFHQQVNLYGRGKCIFMKTCILKYFVGIGIEAADSYNVYSYWFRSGFVG